MSIRAQYEGGPCPAGCGNRIHEGDAIEKVDGEWVHAECTPARDPLELAPNEVVCGTCWIVKPCRCDE